MSDETDKTLKQISFRVESKKVLLIEELIKEKLYRDMSHFLRTAVDLLLHWEELLLAEEINDPRIRKMFINPDKTVEDLVERLEKNVEQQQKVVEKMYRETVEYNKLSVKKNKEITDTLFLLIQEYEEINLSEEKKQRLESLKEILSDRINTGRYLEEE